MSARMPRSMLPAIRASTATDASVTRWIRAINRALPAPFDPADCARWHLRAQVLNIAACFWEPRGTHFMALRIRSIVSFAFLVSLAAPFASAQAPAPKGDGKHGHELSYTCYGCHAIANYK